MSLLGRLFGGKKMAALAAGTSAPQIDLPYFQGGTAFSLEKALSHGPVLAIFFKISCPVCQYALPFFERIHQKQGNRRVTIVGVSQNDKRETEEFVRRFGITFPILMDDTKTYPVSNAYGLTNVPTAFWISQSGEIEVSSVGWSRADVEEIARKTAEANQAQPSLIFQPSEQIADFRAG